MATQQAPDINDTALIRDAISLDPENSREVWKAVNVNDPAGDQVEGLFIYTTDADNCEVIYEHGVLQIKAPDGTPICIYWSPTGSLNDLVITDHRKYGRTALIISEGVTRNDIRCTINDSTEGRVRMVDTFVQVVSYRVGILYPSGVVNLLHNNNEYSSVVARGCHYPSRAVTGMYPKPLDTLVSIPGEGHHNCTITKTRDMPKRLIYGRQAPVLRVDSPPQYDIVELVGEHRVELDRPGRAERTENVSFCTYYPNRNLGVLNLFSLNGGNLKSTRVDLFPDGSALLTEDGRNMDPSAKKLRVFETPVKDILVDPLLTGPVPAAVMGVADHYGADVVKQLFGGERPDPLLSLAKEKINEIRQKDLDFINKYYLLRKEDSPDGV